MSIPTEPIGSIPRPKELMEGARAHAEGRLSRESLDALTRTAVRDTILELERTGSPVVTDGEQAKPSFATYPIAGLAQLAPDGVVIPFADGHERRLPRLTAGPFRFARYAAEYLDEAMKIAHVPVKQAVISASALSLLYPADGIAGYPREEFLEDLCRECGSDLRRCLDAGAHAVQIDFTEARLALKLDPSGSLLDAFIALNNEVLAPFSPQERSRIGIHTCPGGDRDSTHSADVDYAGLLPRLFGLNAGCFYIQLASENDPMRVLELIRAHLRPEQRVFIGVTNPIDPRVETAEEVRDRILQAARILPLDRLGTTDDCGFSPFGDDASTSRETAFGKIRARVNGTALASRELRA